mmetsp:Transcript_90715/g.228133  ORF Transcript_90715/g.228133 Transcript_90715/m.228133 type:complete len:211 (-) Transcript_90715:471-1103(-)
MGYDMTSHLLISAPMSSRRSSAMSTMVASMRSCFTSSPASPQVKLLRSRVEKLSSISALTLLKIAATNASISDLLTSKLPRAFIVIAMEVVSRLRALSRIPCSRGSRILLISGISCFNCTTMFRACVMLLQCSVERSLGKHSQIVGARSKKSGALLRRPFTANKSMKCVCASSCASGMASFACAMKRKYAGSFTKKGSIVCLRKRIEISA